MAAATVLTGWGAPAHAGGTLAPSAQAICIVDDEEPLGANPAVDTPTGADGTYTTPGGTASGVPFSGLPVHVGWTDYRDTNNSGRYDDGTDETVYEGQGDVTACPQTVTLSPK